ncbi:MAG: hypothetical protein JO023_06200, partial [Chloroflexi bacterium]|nr:hypothetical protein [Chloroflexota bacterium]
MLRRRFGAVRRTSASVYQQTLLISGVATVLGLRAYLEATGYPQIGGNGLHIAHMLWGGLFMLAALVLLLSFLGAPARGVAALVGGIGFGLFIDELGKFITSDNDYFFQPTIGLLYLVFVVLFITFRALEVRRPLRSSEALANATDALADLVIRGATPSTRARVLAPLRRSGAVGPFASAVQALVDAAPEVAEEAPSLAARAAASARQLGQRALATPWFRRAIIALFLANAVLAILTVAAVALVLLATAQGMGQTALVREVAANPPPNGWIGTLVSGAASLVSLLFTLIGAARFRANRLAALRWFERSVVVSLLLVDPINFFSLELDALSGLVFDLVLWAGVSYLIHQETT